MKASRELDWEVGKTIFGFSDEDDPGPALPYYSSDMREAWKIVRRFADRWEWELRYRADEGAEVWCRPHVDRPGERFTIVTSDKEFLTMECAICMAAFRIEERERESLV